MNRFFKLFLLLCSLIFSGCDYFTEHDFDINNKSTKTVSFTINNYGTKEYTLASGEKITLSLYDNPQLSFKNNPRVYWVSGVSSGNIKDMNFDIYTISNSCSEAVTISENKNMLGEVFGETALIPAGSSIDVKVYTSNPSWKATYVKDGVEYSAINFLVFTKQQ